MTSAIRTIDPAGSRPAGDPDRGATVRRRLAVLCLGTAAAFAALAILVAAGALDWLDSFGAQHLMPFLSTGHHSSSYLGHALGFSGNDVGVGPILRLPAGALLSSVMVVLLAAVLFVRGDRSWILWLAAFCVGNVIEVGCKLVIAKPTLYTVSGATLASVPLQSSFPSGHALRATLLGAVAVAVFPRLLWPVVAWVAAVLATAELDGIHTVSDLTGGVLLAVFLVLAVLWSDRTLPDGLWSPSWLRRAFAGRVS